MVYGYIRVSSDKQTVENQRYEILKFCDKEKLAVGGWIEETISGTKSVKVRQLGKLLRHVKHGDLIACSELSRLGRNLYMIMEILVSAIARRYKVSRSTVYAFMEREGLHFLQQNNLQKNSDTPICQINAL